MRFTPGIDAEVLIDEKQESVHFTSNSFENFLRNLERRLDENCDRLAEDESIDAFGTCIEIEPSDKYCLNPTRKISFFQLSCVDYLHTAKSKEERRARMEDFKNLRLMGLGYKLKVRSGIEKYSNYAPKDPQVNIRIELWIYRNIAERAQLN